MENLINKKYYLIDNESVFKFDYPCRITYEGMEFNSSEELFKFLSERGYTTLRSMIVSTSKKYRENSFLLEKLIDVKDNFLDEKDPKNLLGKILDNVRVNLINEIY